MHVRKVTYEFYLKFVNEENPTRLDCAKECTEQFLKDNGLWDSSKEPYEILLEYCQEPTRKLELKHIVKKLSLKQSSNTEEMKAPSVW